MNKKTILVSFIAVFAVFAALAVVSAGIGDVVSDLNIRVDGTSYSTSDEISVEAGQTIPIDVVFTAADNASNVEVHVEISGYRKDIEDETDRFDIFSGRTYTKHLSLTLPSDLDLGDDDYTLYVRVEKKNEKDELGYQLRIQRETYNLEILSVESADSITAGSTLGVNVVLKNRGLQRLDDVYVRVSVPEIGLERKTYFGDITPQDEADDKEDAVERTVYLTVPSNAQAGTYRMNVEAYSSDSETSTSKSLAIVGTQGTSSVLSSVTGKTVAVGQEAVFDLIIVNSGNKMKIYNLVPEETANLRVELDESIVTVGADSSKTVKIRAVPVSGEGTYTFAVNVMSDNELVQRMTYTVGVEGRAISAANPIVILTVVLAIIFVVLLIVLIVLLTRKPAETEEETSYY